jgi:outer membrane protein assembly factor BamB
MKNYPALRRWAAALATVTVFAGLVIVAVLSGRGAAQKDAPAGAGDDKPKSWPMFGGHHSRNMVNTTDRNVPVAFNPVKDKQILWKVDLGSKAYGGPIVADGKIFIGSNNQNPRDPKDFAPDPKTKKLEPIDKGVMMCFDAKTGKFLWQHTYPKLPIGRVQDWPKEGICSNPTVEGKKLWYVNNRSEVICSTTDGKVLWTLDMIGKLGVFTHNLSVCSPLIVGDYLFVVTANGVDEGHINIPAPQAPSFIALDKNNGKVLWQNNEPTATLLTFAKNGKADKQQAIAIKALVDAGLLLMHGQWSNPAYANTAGTPQVIFPGGDGWLRAFDPQSGALLWKFDCNPKHAVYKLSGKGTRSDFISTPVVYENKVYIGVGQDPEHDEGIGHFWCIDLEKAVKFGKTNKDHDVSTGTITKKEAGKKDIQYEVFDPQHEVNKTSALAWHYGEDPLGIKPVPAAWKQGRNYVFGRTMSTAAVHDGLVYIAELAGYLHCLDAKTGEQYWTHNTEGAIWGSPYWVDNKIYLGNDAEELNVFQHGKQKKLLAASAMPQGELIRATPVVADGVLYVVTHNKMYAIKK